LAANASRAPATAIERMSSLEGRLLLTKLFVWAFVGVCIGALAGGLAFAAMGQSVAATAFLRLQDPTDLVAVAGGARQVTPDSQDHTTQFVAGEVAYLSSDGFARAVARKMAKDEPVDLKVIQENESSVVSMSCSSSSGEEARRTVQTAVDLYAQQLEQRVDRQVRTILPTLSEWQSGAEADPSRVQTIQRLRDSVQLQADMMRNLLVMQSPALSDPGVDAWVVGAVVGGLVGGACVVAVLLVRWRRSGVGTVARVVAGSADGVLLPAVDLDMPPRDAWSTEQARIASTLYAICPASTTSRVILVVGASASSGASVISGLLELAVVQSPERSAVTTRVVDGGAIGDEALTADLIEAATTVVLVTRLASDDAATAECGLNFKDAARDVPLMAVFTYRRRTWA
jgi:uncharacterized protein YcfJ